MLRPGTKRRLLDASPSAESPWYINDHTIIRAADGRWHVFGIWHPEPASPLDERFFLHASAPELREGAFEVHDPVQHARSTLGETHVWAPHVIEHAGLYWMFYCGGTEDHSRYRMELATSTDLFTWEHHTGGTLFEDGFDARDPMVLRRSDHWLMYYTRTSAPGGGFHEVAVRRSRDLVDWSPPQVAYRSHESGTVGGPTESPFVIEVAGGWILFVCESGEYDRTLAYFSRDPLHFEDAGRIDVDLDEHCAEIITATGGDITGRERADRHLITGGGWGRGGLSIRDLDIFPTPTESPNDEGDEQ